MKTHYQSLRLETRTSIELIDVTERVQSLVTESGFVEGLVTLTSPHTTAYVNLNERETMLQRDMVRFLTELVPRELDYLHNRAPVDGRDNAHSHLLGLFMTASVSIPLVAGALRLGDWQSIFFVELDGPRPERRLDIQVIGQG